MLFPYVGFIAVKKQKPKEAMNKGGETGEERWGTSSNTTALVGAEAACLTARAA